MMNTKNILQCSILLAVITLAYIPTFVRTSHDYAYFIEETIWEEERAYAREGLRTAWQYIKYWGNKQWYFPPDSLIMDTIVPDPRIVSGGELHKIEFIRNGKNDYLFYYQDVNQRSIYVLCGVTANNEQPYSLDDYYYINKDGYIIFNTCKYIEMVLWYLNVLVSPWLWLCLLLLLIYRGVRSIVKKSKTN